jgi:hypothetical protein
VCAWLCNFCQDESLLGDSLGTMMIFLFDSIPCWVRGCSAALVMEAWIVGWQPQAPQGGLLAACFPVCWAASGRNWWLSWGAPGSTVTPLDREGQVVSCCLDFFSTTVAVSILFFFLLSVTLVSTHARSAARFGGRETSKA